MYNANSMMMSSHNLIGVDIGGTKCAVTYGVSRGSEIEIVHKLRFDTMSLQPTLDQIVSSITSIMQQYDLSADNLSAIGISCGGPLDSKKGLILSPPNLPGWDNVPIVELLRSRFGVEVGLANDANACALAEWTYGAGVGSQNMIFLTFGTGMGAGLILDGKLYAGTNDNAGEVGHMRLSHNGPVGYGKSGSFEGFCSGGGIAQIARSLVLEQQQMGHKPQLLSGLSGVESITAKRVAELAANGDELSLDIIRIAAERLGQGLSILIDVLNPELIVIGSIYTRCEDLFAEQTNRVIERESLLGARRVCRVVPSKLAENIGDIAALSVAANMIKR